MVMVPDRIDRYQIIETIGQGGFGVVYRAYDARLQRQVAIKLLREEPASFPDTANPLTPKTARERFVEEAQTLVKLDVDGVVRIYDFGDYNGRPYLVMQYMPGGTLAEKIRGAPLSLEDTAVILNRLCTTLDKIHQRQTIHRDLKPLNVLFNAEGEAYLSDFGIARLVENSRSTAGIGTPRYMAPEQFMDEKPTIQTDIYQMGVILFEMLTGKTPFDASTSAAVIQKVLNQPTPSVSEINPTLDPAIDDIIRT